MQVSGVEAMVSYQLCLFASDSTEANMGWSHTTSIR